jgi:hypothetical protein
MVNGLLRRFMSDDYVRSALLEKLRKRDSGSGHFTFSEFNVLLEFDVGTATIEDKLILGAGCSLPGRGVRRGRW